MARVLLAPVSFGLGDLVVSLPVVQALIEKGQRGGDQTWLVARAQSQALLAPRIGGLSGCVYETSLGVVEPGDQYIDLRDHPLQRDFWWGSPEFEDRFGPLNINDILARICADFGIAADLSRPIPLHARPRPELAESVLLVTETDGPSKVWSEPRWAALARLLEAAGLKVRQVAREHAS